jgi:hypothetical protein
MNIRSITQIQFLFGILDNNSDSKEQRFIGDMKTYPKTKSNRKTQNSKADRFGTDDKISTIARTTPSPQTNR